MPRKRKESQRENVDLTVVVDRSGSMSTVADDAENGLNEFFKRQREEAPDTVLTLVHFDTEYEFVHKAEPIEKVEKYTLIPRGMTALLDAVGKAAAEALERLQKHPAAKKIFVVLTDGHENSSKEYNRSKVAKMLDRLKNEAFELVFLGANIDSFAEAGSLNIPIQNTANFVATPQGMRSAMAAVCRNAVSYSTGQATSMAYTDDQRSSMMGGDPGNVTVDKLNEIRQNHGLSWSALERAAGLGNGTLQKYANSDTQQISNQTAGRLRAVFPDELKFD